MGRIPNKLYEELAYIESTGTQFINTTIKGYTAFKLKFQLLGSGSNQYGIFGSRQSGGANRFGCMRYDGGFHFMIGSANMWNAPIDNNVHELDFNSERLIADGVEYATPSGQNYGTSDFYLFAMNLNSSGRIPQRIWYFQTFDENGNITHDFVPCRRKDTGVIGLLDLVYYDFYSNDGTGTFSYGLLVESEVSPSNSGTVSGSGTYVPGNNVTLTATANSGYEFEKWELNDYYLLTGIESTGTQYIDTGVVNKTGLKFIVECSFITEDGRGTVLAQGNSSKYAPWISREFIRPSKGYRTYNSSPSLSLNEKHRIEVTDSGCIVDGISHSYTTNNELVPGGNIWLFRRADGNYYGHVKLNLCQIYDGNTLIRNFIPVIQKGTIEFGLLDLVQMKFYKNSGTGQFLAYEPSPSTDVILTDNPLSLPNLQNSFELTAYFKSLSNCRYKVNGTWKNGTMYIKENGTWKSGTPKIKVNGAWKEGG